ncbi:outer membrane protein assembly factor BamE [Thermomonas flagellata]|uniref:outer membrane protein assembly factor BamE n=1 Tax=Thermomonas flagellata TaxID=2888524 RepID=UPI001F04E449|nr:outer membrane protein assembly factor BamE [Thermomonas flagellata]
MRTLPLLLLAILATSGCGIIYRQPLYQGNLLDATAVGQLQPGMDKRQVMTVLGTPSVQDPFHQDRWDYAAAQRTGRVGKTEVKTLTVYFKDGVLERWEGDYFPEQDAQLADQVVKEFGPNLAKDKDKERRRRR